MDPLNILIVDVLHELVPPVVIDFHPELRERVPVVQRAGLDDDDLRVLGRLRRQGRAAVAAELAAQLGTRVRVVHEELWGTAGEVQRGLGHDDVRGEGGASVPLAVGAVAGDDLWKSD